MSLPWPQQNCPLWDNSSFFNWIWIWIELNVLRYYYHMIIYVIIQLAWVTLTEVSTIFFFTNILVSQGAGIAQWLERRTRDRKVTGSNPFWSGGRIFFSRVNFLCWLLFRYPFHPRVTAVARKRPRSFCQKRSWQVTAKHAYTLRMWLCMKWHGAWLGVHRTRRDWLSGSRFLWHQPCQRCKYTTSVDIQKRAIKSYSLM